VTTNSDEGAQHSPEPLRPLKSLGEQARTLGTPPIGSGEFYAHDGIVGSAEEVDEFLDFLYQSRRADTM
jgi:hypothetical protein